MTLRWSETIVRMRILRVQSETSRHRQTFTYKLFNFFSVHSMIFPISPKTPEDGLSDCSTGVHADASYHKSIYNSLCVDNISGGKRSVGFYFDGVTVADRQWEWQGEWLWLTESDSVSGWQWLCERTSHSLTEWVSDWVVSEWLWLSLTDWVSHSLTQSLNSARMVLVHSPGDFFYYFATNTGTVVGSHTTLHIHSADIIRHSLNYYTNK